MMKAYQYTMRLGQLVYRHAYVTAMTPSRKAKCGLCLGTAGHHPLLGLKRVSHMV